MAGEDQTEAERERESLSSLAGGDPGQAEPSREGEWRREGSLATSLFNSFFINQLINLTNLTPLHGSMNGEEEPTACYL